MMSFLYETPIYGNYSLFLFIAVLLLVLKLFVFSSEQKIPTRIENNKVENTEVQLKSKTTQRKGKKCGGNKNLCSKKIKLKNNILHIYYESSCEELLKFLTKSIENSGFEFDITNLSVEFNIEEKLPRNQDGATLFILNDGETVKWCEDWLYSSSINAKMEKNYLKDIKFAVFDSVLNGESIAPKWDKYLWKLGGRRLKKLNTKLDTNKCISDTFSVWSDDLMLVVKGSPKKKVCACGPKKKDNGCSSGSDGSGSGSSSCDSSDEGAGLIDVEDLLLPS